MSFFLRIFISATCLLIVATAATALERRKPQFATESAYLILPMPYSLPGIGSGLMVTGLAGNMFETYTDVFASYATGDIQGMFGGLMDFHLVDETLFFDVYLQEMSAQMNSYKHRGMIDGEDDYQILNAEKRTAQYYVATLSLFDRRFEVSYEIGMEEITMDKVLDENGDILIEIDDPKPERTENTVLSMVVDITDDRQDPLKGFRLKAAWFDVPHTEQTAADYYVLNLGASAYIPVGNHHTWAFNYQTSEAIVRKKGETGPDAIIQELGLACASYNTCSEEEQELIDGYITSRTYGTASSLGGDDELRAYPMGRFKGAHTAYLATEFRWNFATDVVPFDFWIWKDIATGFQLAAFHEIGSVAEVKADLWKASRSSSGLGFRMVSASGFVYRADVATGNEGIQTTIMFMYPW